MTKSIRGKVPHLLSCLILLGVALPQQAHACACGCGMFDVSTSGVLPNGEGGTIWLEQDYMSQSHNHEGSHSASDTLNDDKKIRTSYTQLGGQYMFNRDWGVKATVPYMQRNFVTTDDTTGEILSFEHKKIGDIRVSGIYSGFSPDMSAGLTFGLKLPTGSTKDEGFDRDTAIGTGSTNLLLGGYKMGRFSNASYGWFANGVLDQPVLTKGDYRPGTEINASVGTYYEGWSVGSVKVTPLFQVIGAHRWKDSGSQANPDGSGYTRMLASPGLEFGFGATKLYTDVSVPFYDHVRGDQLVAPALFKAVVSYDF